MALSRHFHYCVIILSIAIVAVILVVAYHQNPEYMAFKTIGINRRRSPMIPRSDSFGHECSCNCSDNEERKSAKYEEQRLHDEGSSKVQSGEINIEKAIPPLDELYRRLAIVTAISTNHYEEALPWIASIQRFMPNKTIIVYDIGLNSDSLEKVKRLCNVEVRPFPFDSYPPHVKNLLTYAWKPIIIDTTLREYGVVFWGDASIRVKGSLRDLLPLAMKHHGYMTHFHAFDPKKKEEIKHNYFFTHPKLFEKLGINRTEYYLSDDAAPHAAANRQLYINSSVIQEKIVQPMLKCALEFGCISPGDAHYGPHRFDASILALLVYKNMKMEWTREDNDNRFFDEIVYLARNTVGKEHVKFCS